MDESIIKTKRLILRPIEERDTDFIVAARNSDFIRNFFIFRETFTPEMHQRWLKEKVNTGEVVQYIITDEITGESIGSVFFIDIDRNNKRAEFGIFICEQYTGKGYGTETIKSFIRYGFDILKLHRISLRLLANNEVARNLYLKAGFEVEGVFKDYVRIDNAYRDIIFMSIINPDL